MVLKYTETGNVLGTMKRFQRQFPNRKTPCRQIIMDNYNKYVGCPVCLSLNRNVGKLLDVPVLKPSDCFQKITDFCILKNINTRSSTENCGVGYAPAIFLQFFYFLFNSSVPVLGFTYRKAV